jgi:hypothetical protein
MDVRFGARVCGERSDEFDSRSGGVQSFSCGACGLESSLEETTTRIRRKNGIVDGMSGRTGTCDRFGDEIESRGNFDVEVFSR